MGAKKICIITGSARGIGAACLRVFAQHEYAVIGMDMLPEGQQVADGINQQGANACSFPVMYLMSNGSRHASSGSLHHARYR